MHPKTLDEYLALKARDPAHPLLKIIAGEAQHFYASPAIYDAALEIATHESSLAVAHELPWPVPSSARPPAKATVLTVSGPTGREDTLVLLSAPAAPEVAVYVIAKGLVASLGFYDYRSALIGHVRSDFATVKLSDDQSWASLMHTAFIVSLINTPTKIVKTVDTVSRQHRKRVEAVTGAPILGYTRIAWELGAANKAHGRDGEGEGGVALHWCRAYFRRACENEPKAEWLNLPYKGGWGWYCWVKDCWKGDYRFGLKLHDYHPEIAGADGKTVRRPAPFTASSADRLAMLEAEKQAAIRAASRAA